MRISDWSSDVCSSDLWTEDSIAALKASLAAYYEKVGQRAADAALVSGQHSHPQGIFYGGTEACWSHRTVQAICEKYLGTAKRICVLDHHTGLGPFGYSEMICRHAPGSEALNLARRWFGHAVLRSHERRVGNELVSTCRSLWSTYH